MGKAPARKVPRGGPRIGVKSLEDSDPNVAAAAARIDPRYRDVLDKSQKFGTVAGRFEVGGVSVAYEQGRTLDGKNSRLYGLDLQRVYRPGEEAAEADLRRKRAAQGLTVNRRQAPPPVRAAPQPVPVEEEDDREETLPPMIVEDDGPVNLHLWAVRQAHYVFGKVREAIEERYHAIVTNEDDAITLLVKEKVVTEAEVRQAEAGG